jgi:hypothetical protein
MIKVYMMKYKKETLLKEYRTLKGALDFMESEKNYTYILYAMKNNKVIAIQGKQQPKNIFEKVLDLFHIG